MRSFVVSSTYELDPLEHPPSFPERLLSFVAFNLYAPIKRFFTVADQVEDCIFPFWLHIYSRPLVSGESHTGTGLSERRVSERALFAVLICTLAYVSIKKSLSDFPLILLYPL